MLSYIERLFFRGLYADSSFKAAVEHIQKYSHISGNVLELALEMEALHVKPYRWMYPAVRAAGRADDAWHGVNWRGRPEQPPVRCIWDSSTVKYCMCVVDTYIMYRVLCVGGSLVQRVCDGL